MKHATLWIGIVVVGLMAGNAFADDNVMKELAPTGKLRVGIAVGPNPGAGNVAIDQATGKVRGIAADLGAELAQKLRVPVEFVPYPNSGALTDAAGSGTWDVAFIPVDDERKKKVDFGPAHVVLQSTYLVAPGSPIRTLEPMWTSRAYGWPAWRIPPPRVRHSVRSRTSPSPT